LIAVEAIVAGGNGGKGHIDAYSCVVQTAGYDVYF